MNLKPPNDLDGNNSDCGCNDGSCEGISVLTHGAVGDGDTDDSAAFTAADAEVYEAGGGKVCIPAGTYRVTGVPWHEGTFWHGEGPGASILQPVSDESTTPMFEAVATATVESTERFTHGGFFDLEIDGLDQDGACIGISTSDLQTVAPIDAASGLYTWDQHIIFENLYVHDCAIGIDLWGDSRYVPFVNCRFWDNDVGTYIQGNHPNMRNVEYRFNRIGIDCTQILDAEFVGCKFNQNDYGVGGSQGRTDRYGKEKGRVDRTRFVGCQFFENHILGLRINIQVQVIACFFTGDVDDDESILLEINAGGCRVANSRFHQTNPGICVAVRNLSDGITETIHIDLEHNSFTVDGGGRCVEKVAGTNDIQGFKLHGNNFSLQSVPDDGLGAAAFLLPASMGNFEHFSITENYIWSEVRQPDYMVQVLTASTKGYRHTNNDYVSTQAVGASKGFKVLDSVKAIVTDNRFTGGSSGTTGFGDPTTDPTFMMNLGTTTGAAIHDNPDWKAPAAAEVAP